MKPGMARWLFVMGSLVVTIILAVPAFQAQRRERQRTISAANLRQWGIALTLYMGESQNCLPLPGSKEALLQQDNAWFNALPPYLGVPMLKDLPPGQRPSPDQSSLWINPAARSRAKIRPDQFYFCYGMNEKLLPEEGSSLKIYNIDPPSSVVFLAEVEGFDPVSRPDTVVRRHGPNPPNSPESFAHVLFCDGHVEAVNGARFEKSGNEPGTVHWDFHPSLNP
jgi:prepilin-type processing-associated H-X9-DG protein